MAERRARPGCSTLRNRNPATSDKGPAGALCRFRESRKHVADKAVQIATLLTPTVHALGLELLGADYLPSPGGAVLRLYIDTPLGDERVVGIEDCEAVSREVSAQLDVEDPITSHYTLEVSSPGVDRPLFTAAQFERFIGEQAKVGMKLPQDGRRRLTGAITAVEGDVITFDVALRQAQDERSELVTVAVENIEKARLVPDWVALGLAPAQDKSGRDARPGKQAKKKPDNTRTDKPAAVKPQRAE